MVTIVLHALVAAAFSCAAGDDWPPRRTPAEAGVDAAALERLLVAARAAKSDAIAIVVDGALVCEEYFDRPRPEPIELMSCTKSVVSLLVGILIDERKIASLDAPIATWYPEWKEGPKAAITVRHVLAHVSGLATKPTTEEIYASDDFVKLALEADLADPPATRFVYNNKAVNLLAGVIAKASGQPMDEFARERLFDPLGIPEFGWTKDRSGNPHGMAGLQLATLDFARLGQLLLEGGEWEGERIVSRDWLAASMAPAFPQLGASARRCGLLWWLERDGGAISWDDALIESWKKAGGSKLLLQVGDELRGKKCTGIDEARALLRPAVSKVSTAAGGEAVDGSWFDLEVSQRNVPFWNEEPGPVVAWRADGYLGNYLVVCPSKKLVAVRQRRYPNDPRERDDPRNAMPDFTRLALALRR
jgi:CubicO group peptidase (beta-lactamase class C family)